MFEHLPRPTIIAHRGASAHAPENTLVAFELAASQNADAIELDATLCADDHVIVFHDDTVDRTTDGSGLVKELFLASLKEFDAGCSFDDTFCGEKIPTLSEVFDAVGQKIFINIELKNYTSPRDALPERVAHLVEQHNLSHRVFFSSFNPIALRRIKKLLPQTPLGILATPGISGFWARSFPRRWLSHEAIHPHIQDVTLKWIARKQQRGYRLYVYTVNLPQDMACLCRWGVDGFFTDDPLLARRVIETESTPKEAKS